MKISAYLASFAFAELAIHFPSLEEAKAKISKACP